MGWYESVRQDGVLSGDLPWWFLFAFFGGMFAIAVIGAWWKEHAPCWWYDLTGWVDKWVEKIFFH